MTEKMTPEMTPEQIKNFRKVLALMGIPCAMFFNDSMVQEFKNVIESRIRSKGEIAENDLKT